MVDLIINCTDYLIDYVSLSLAHSSLTTSGCLVLQAVITCGLVSYITVLISNNNNNNISCSSYQVLPLITDCKESLLLCLTQQGQDDCNIVRLCWNVLYSLAVRLPEWIRIEELEHQIEGVPHVAPLIPEDPSATEMTARFEDIEEFFNKHHRKKEEKEQETGDRNGTLINNEESSGEESWIKYLH